MNILTRIEHTALKAETTPGDVDQLCREAIEHGFHGVCVNPVYVPRAVRSLWGSNAKVVTVIGFPLGAGTEASDEKECEAALAAGATELDWVIPIGLARAGDLATLERRAALVRRATSGAVLKVIFECGCFEPQELEAVVRCVFATGPDFLKTATGFGPRGATRADVELLNRVGAGHARVKASGGIRTLALAREMVAAGASRLGTSSGVAIAAELAAERSALGE